MTMGELYDGLDWDKFVPAEELMATICKVPLPEDPAEKRQQRAKLLRAAMYAEGKERESAIAILARYGVWEQVVKVMEEKNLIT